MGNRISFQVRQYFIAVKFDVAGQNADGTDVAEVLDGDDAAVADVAAAVVVVAAAVVDDLSSPLSLSSNH
ncbi:hypothetical protein BGZ49_006880 [Haplosporangium sp. Z 27]|nr:hypothetical protein BGZ49_006880 [Haplosporangium sp. Z 27]